ncbi:MAG: T9SS type A sorting domain-containing protein, partial [Dolichospermum sp.]
FPVGKDTVQNARVEFTTAPTKGGVLTAEFIKNAPTKAGLPLTDGAVTIERVANEGFWRIENDTITGGNYTLSLTGRKFAGINVLATLRTLKRPNNGTTWSLDGTASTNTGTVAIPVVVRTGMSGFSEFAIGGGTDNVLPFTKLTFTGTKNGTGNLLRWAVENELNSRGYELQRSIDGINFSEISFAQSKNYTNTAANTEYVYSDLRPFSGNTYYRLKIIDNDGTFKYSNVVLVRGLRTTNIAISGIYPNPVKSILNVIVSSPEQKDVTVQIININGQVVKTIANKVIDGDNLMSININNLAKGIYTISLLQDKKVVNSLTFIKE